MAAADTIISLPDQTTLRFRSAVSSLMNTVSKAGY
jgi:hypothetical protein